MLDNSPTSSYSAIMEDNFPPSFVEADPLPTPVPGKDYTTGLTGRRYVPGVPGGVPIEGDVEVRHRKLRSRSVLRSWDSMQRMKLWLRMYATCGDSKRATERVGIQPRTLYNWLRNPWFKSEMDSLADQWKELIAGGISNLNGKALAMVEHVLDMAMDKDNVRMAGEGLKAALVILRSEGMLRDRVEPEEGRGGATVQIIGGVTYLAPWTRELPKVELSAIGGETSETQEG